MIEKQRMPQFEGEFPAQYFIAPESARADRQTQLDVFQEALIEADQYLEQWQKQVAQFERENPISEEQRSYAGDAVGRYLREEDREFFNWYKANIVPLRTKQGLENIWAHGTALGSLFGPAVSRQMDVQDSVTGKWSVQKIGQGILNEGLTREGFGIFEETEQGGGMGGWWRREGVSPTEDRVGTACWLLVRPDRKGERAQEEAEDETQMRHNVMVFPDPRAYRKYLESAREMIEGGQMPVLHSAMRLDQLKTWLEKHEGLLPDEVEYRQAQQ